MASFKLIFANALAEGIVTIILATAASAAGYDGTYVGTSANYLGTSRSGKGNACGPMKAPYPLTISNGHAQAKWGESETLDGDVGPDGKLVMHSSMSGRFEGQVAASGAITGNYQGYCIYALTWQKR